MPDREEWERELRARQRNVVFPDTVRNEGTFWRNLLKYPLRPAHVIGFVLIVVFFGGSVATIFVLIWQGMTGTWYDKLRYFYPDIATIVVAVTFLWLYARWDRSRRAKGRRR
jgi:hypothetical protein